METGTKKFGKRLPLIILLLVTVIFWVLYDRYEVAGPTLLESPTLADGTHVRGEVTENAGQFTLTVPKGGKTARIDFNLPNPTEHPFIRVTARMKATGVVQGKNSWNCARMLLAQYTDKNRWIPGPHALASARGTSRWKKDVDEFELQPNVARVAVILEQIGTEGTAEFDQIKAYPVRIRTSFMPWRIVFALAWLFMGGLYFPRCRLHRRKLKILIFLNALAILSGALMPGNWIKDGSEWTKKTVAEWVAKPTPAKVAEKSGTVIKPARPARDTQQMERFNKVVGDAHRVGHFILFATLCFLVYLSAALEHQHPIYFIKVGFDVLLFAAVTESLQFLTTDRTAGLSDLRIDLYGMALAFALFLLIWSLFFWRPWQKL